MDEQTARLLDENVWELERQLADGHATRESRWALLDAQGAQLAYSEERLGIPPEHRSVLRVNRSTQTGVLLIHGSTGSPADMRGLADSLYDAGCTVYAMRLPGHGIPDADLSSVSWRSCLLDLENRYRMLAAACPQLHLLGYSLGSALMMQISPQPRPQSLVMIAPAIFPRLNLIQRLVSYLGLDRWSWFRSALGWDGEVLEAMVHARQTNWWREIPTLAAIASDDPRIDTSSLGWVKRRLQHPRSQCVRYADGGHLFFLGERKAEFRDAVLEFIQAG